VLTERPSLTSAVRAIAEEVLTVSFEDIPAEELHQAKRLLLDTLGCALASRDCAAAEAVVASLDDLGGRPEATVLGTGERTSALNAILANGAMVRFLDLNDVQSSASRPGPRHGHNSEIYPVLLALCEREGLSGRDLLTAAWLSYEISTRFTESIPGRSLEFRGWNLDTRASFVVPLIAGKLLGLNAEQIANAVGIALSRGLVLEVMDHPSEVNSMAKNLRYPLTAHLGVTAAYLARNGLTGPARALEGGDGFIERVLDTEHDLQPEQVTAVRIKTTTRGARHTGDPSRKHPQNKETADHSTYYVQAAVITDRALGPAQYTPERLNDPGINRLAEVVTIEGDPELDDVYPSAHVWIDLADGTTVDKYIGHPVGSSQNPLTDTQVEEKFTQLASAVLDPAGIRAAIDAVWSVDSSTDLTAFAATFVR
jgi:2-methylcitrate dehydratase